MLVVAAGVSCASPPTPTPTPAATPFPTTTATPTPEPPSVRVIRVAAFGQAQDRDLHQVVSERATLFGPGPAYSRLLRYKSGPEVQLPSMAVECDLCESWQVVDPLTYEFRLHPDARWQSVEGFSGRPVTSQDVVFSLERLRTPGWPHATLLAAVRDLVAVDERTVRLTLHYADPELPQALANPHAVIVAPEIVQADGLSQGPVAGSGPWRWEERASGQMDLTAFEGYHRPGVPKLSGVQMLLVDTLAQGATLLAVEQVDIAQVPEEKWNQLEAQGVRSRLLPRQGSGLMVALNAASPPLDQLEVRQALLLSLDPEAALAEVWDGLGRVGVGVPVVEPGWLLDDDELAGYFAQPGRAAQLLTDTQETPVPLTLTVANFGDRYVEYGRLAAEQMTRAGFQVTVEPLSRSQYLAAAWQEKRFQAFVGPLPPVSSANSFLLPLLHSEGQWHITGHQDQELDRLIEEQSTDMDAARRGELLRQIQGRVLAQGLMFMPVITMERWAYSSRVTDFHPNLAAGDGSFWRTVGIDEGAE